MGRFLIVDGKNKDDDKKEKPKPVKAQPQVVGEGGIFTSKIIQIMKEVKRFIKRVLGKEDEEVSG